MSEQLTNSELNWIEGWIDAFDADTYAAEILGKLVAAARRTIDEETTRKIAVYRAEQAESGYHEVRKEYDDLFDEAEKIRHQRDEARQEAAKLRESLERIADTDDAIRCREIAGDALETGIPDPVPTDRPGNCTHPDCGAFRDPQRNSGWACSAWNDGPGACAAENSNPRDASDRTEPSEALAKSERDLRRLSNDMADRIAPEEVSMLQAIASEMRRHLSHPAPAVPEAVRQPIEELHDLLSGSWSKDQLIETVNRARRACGKRAFADGDSPAVPDAVRRLPDKWMREAEMLKARGEDGRRDASGLEICAYDLKSALAQPSESPAVPEGIQRLPRDMRNTVSDLRQGSYSSLSNEDAVRIAVTEHWADVIDRILAAAPTPTDDGE